MKYHRLLTIMLAFASTAFCIAARQTERDKAKLPERELRELYKTITDAPRYIAAKENLIARTKDSLHRAATDEKRWQLSQRLAATYRTFNTDSALAYSFSALRISDSLSGQHRLQSKIMVVDALSTAGLFTPAIFRFDSLSTAQMDYETKIRYWIVGRRLSAYMISYVQGDEKYMPQCGERFILYNDSLLANLPPADPLREYIACERLVAQKKYHEAQLRLDKLMPELAVDDNLYGMAAFQLAEVYRAYDNEEKYAEMLAKASISDIKCSIREGLALPNLAYWLYEQGNLNEAYEVLNFALEEATRGNVRMRAVTMSNFIPVIDDAYRSEINSNHQQLFAFFVIVTMLLLLTVILAIVLARQTHQARADEKKLEKVAERQQASIGHFIGLYSSYADRLTRLKNLVSLKLSSGQTGELKKLIESGRFEDQDNDDIHKIFDAAFLDIYPNFIERVNELLKPEDRFTVKSNGVLTPELRIYAFVRLGVDESTRIAQILHYSPNTVYAYRNKMRNRAISRETFDQDVASL